MEKAWKKLRGREVLETAQRCVTSGRYRFHNHCRSRLAERNIGRTDIERSVFTAKLESSRWNPHSPPPNWYYLVVDIAPGTELCVVLYFLEENAEPFLIFFTCFVRGASSDE